MERKNHQQKPFYTRLTWCVTLGFLLFLLSPGTAWTAQDEEPIKVIKQNGTAGMQLQGGKKILVKGNKLYVQSGKQIRALFPDKPHFMVKSNTSKINNREIQSLGMRAAQSKFPDLYQRSYKVHSHFKLKTQKGNQKTVVAHLVFQYKNIWYSQERTMEMDITATGRTHSLKQVRPAPLLARPITTKRMRIKKRVVATKRGKTAIPATKKANYKLVTERIDRVKAKYTDFRTLPVYRLARDFNFTLKPWKPTARGLANTAYPEVVTAKDATDQVHIIMNAALGSAGKLIGPTQSSKNALLNWLRNDGNLVAWNNIGHGNSSTLFMNGSQIGSGDLTPSPNVLKGLNGCVCLVNSCQTFKDPLKAAIISNNPRVYIAGVVNLPMVTSEGSNPNFWFKTLILHKPMSVAYTETNTASGLTGYWGYWGDPGKF